MLIFLLLSWLSDASSLRILLIGDSLTEGFISADDLPTLHPYAARLELLLKGMEKSGLVMVEGKGVGGEQVLPAMSNRLRLILAGDKTIRRSDETMEPYHFILILGGINDIINAGASAEHIFQSGLEDMYSQVHAHGARLVALTLPSFDTTRITVGDEERRKLNRLIVGFVNRHREAHREHYPLLVDLESSIGPFSNLTGLFSRDGLHLSIKGYDKLSEDAFRILEGEIRMQGHSLENNAR